MSGNIHDTKINILTENINNMLIDLKDNIKIDFEKKYEYLFKISPKLFNLIKTEHNKKSFKRENIDTFLHLISSIQESKISQNDASQEVGSLIAKQYIPAHILNDTPKLN